MALNIKSGVNLYHSSEPVIDSSKLRSDAMSVTTGFNGALDFKRHNFYMGVYSSLKHWVLNTSTPLLQELNDSGSAPSTGTGTRFAFMPAITGGSTVTQDRLYCVGSSINSWMNINSKAWTAGTTQSISGTVRSVLIPNKVQQPAYTNSEGIIYVFNSGTGTHYKKDEETPGAWATLSNSASGIGTGYANLWAYNQGSGDYIYRINGLTAYTVSIERYTISTDTWSTIATNVAGPSGDYFAGNYAKYTTDGTYLYIVMYQELLASSSSINPFRYVYRIDPTTVADNDTISPIARIRVSDVYTNDYWRNVAYDTAFIDTFEGIDYLYESTYNSTLTRMATWRTPLPD